MARYRYKIEEWDREFGGEPFFVAFVRGWWRWRELGRADSKEQAEKLCRAYKAPARRRWFYSADAI